LINVNHKDLFVVPDKDSTPAGGRDHCADLYFDDGFAHDGKLLVVNGSRQRVEAKDLAESGHHRK
jgi:hypothetical protein